MAISLGGFSGGGGAGAITSVNGQTGIVVLNGDNIESNHTATNYTPTSSTIAGHLSGIDAQLGTLVGGLTYKGTFNATTGLTNTGGNLNNALQGDLYIIDTAGIIYGVTWAIGDHLLINENMGGSIVNTRIDKIDNTEPNALIATNNLSDLDNAATARTNLGLAIGTDVQAYDAQLADVAGLATTDGGFIVGNGSNFVLESGSTVRTSLGLGSAAQAATTDFLASTAGLNDLSDVTITAAASGEYLRYSGSAWVDASLGIVDDTAPSLGGDLDTNDNEIVTASNRNVILRPNGTGVVQLGGNTNPAELRLYCESSDLHYVGLKSPTHSELGGGSVTWRLPTADASTSGDALVSDGAGNLSFTTISGGGGSAPSVTTNTSFPLTISTTTGIEEIHLIDNGASAVVVTLPAVATAGTGYKYNIKRLGSGTVTIETNGSETIDGSANFSIGAQNDSITLGAGVQCGTDTWFLI